MPRRRDDGDRAEAEAVARALADESPGRLERKILEELVYERVRSAVNLCHLTELELDLSASIERALPACADSPGERNDLLLDYLHRAWDRVTDEVLGWFVDHELSGALGRARVDDPAPDTPRA